MISNNEDPDPYDKSIIGEKPQAAGSQSQSMQIDVEYIKEYLKSHPEAWKDLLSDYKSDIENLLDSAGVARPLVENALKSKVPWLWEAVNPNSNGNTPNITHERTDIDLDDEPESHYDSINEDDWKSAMEYAIELRKLRIPPGKISDKIMEHYGIDIVPTHLARLINDYILDQKTDSFLPDIPSPSGRGQGSSRLNDSILSKIAGLMSDKKSLEEKLRAFESKPEKSIGLIRTLWKKIY